MNNKKLKSMINDTILFIVLIICIILAINTSKVSKETESLENTLNGIRAAIIENRSNINSIQNNIESMKMDSTKATLRELIEQLTDYGYIEPISEWGEE